MKFLLLGPVQFVVDGSPIALGRRRERLMLAMLALTAGQPVTVDRLAAAVWEGDEPPETARSALKVSVSRLRRVLAPHGVTITARADTYALDATGVEVDAAQFRMAVSAARERDDLYERATGLRTALALWRGDVMEDVAGPEIRRSLAGDLLALRQRALRWCIEADVAGGRREQAIAELRGLVATNPTDEGFVEVLMNALVAGGRPAEALDVYAEVRRRLTDELGVDPGARLLELHTRILRQHATIGDSVHESAATDRVLRMSIQTLPRDLPALHGRDAEFASLGQAVHAAQPAPLVIVTGPGGVGKTALAVHWAHRATSLFPDGQLFVNLHGYGSGQPPSTTEALAQLLLSLGEPLATIPPGVGHSVAMYRARLAGRRMLIVVDNAATAEQVRPLLPGSAGCGVVVTSRDPLTGLADGDGAERVALRQLNVEHSIAVLRGVVGNRRIHDEPDAATDLAALCGGLPLALRVAAANLAGRPEISIASYREEMTRGSVLDSLQVDGDITMGVRATLSSSYNALSSHARLLFRMLGALAGGDFTIAVCAAMTSETQVDVTILVDELCRAHLVEQQGDDRYAMHDLVRAYAVEVGRGSIGSEAARGRLLRFYLDSMNSAAEVAYPDRRYLTDERTPEAPTFHTRRTAIDWLDAEVTNLVAEAIRAAEIGPYQFAWQVCDALAGYFWLRRHAALWIRSIEAAERATQTAEDAAMAVLVRHRRGIMHWAYGEYEPAELAFRGVLDDAEQIGDQRRVAAALGNLGAITRELGRIDESRAYASRALRLHLDAGNLASAAANLLVLATLSVDVAEFAVALDYARKAESIYRQMDNAEGIGAALLAVAEVLVDSQAPYADITAVLDEAGDLYAEIGAAPGQTTTWSLYSQATLDDGRPVEALAYAERAWHAVSQTKNTGQAIGVRLARGMAWRALADDEAAAADFEAAERDSRAIGIASGIALALIAQAEMAIAGGDLTRARKLATEALAFAHRTGETAKAKRLIAVTEA